MRPCVGYKELARLDRQRALLAFEVMKLEILGFGGREFAEEVTFRGVRVFCVEVIQFCQSLKLVVR
jgi:hypothetical protein